MPFAGSFGVPPGELVEGTDLRHGAGERRHVEPDGIAVDRVEHVLGRGRLGKVLLLERVDAIGDAVGELAHGDGDVAGGSGIELRLGEVLRLGQQVVVDRQQHVCRPSQLERVLRGVDHIEVAATALRDDLRDRVGTRGTQHRHLQTAGFSNSGFTCFSTPSLVRPPPHENVSVSPGLGTLALASAHLAISAVLKVVDGAAPAAGYGAIRVTISFKVPRPIPQHGFEIDYKQSLKFL